MKEKEKTPLVVMTQPGRVLWHANLLLQGCAVEMAAVDGGSLCCSCASRPACWVGGVSKQRSV